MKKVWNAGSVVTVSLCLLFTLGLAGPVWAQAQQGETEPTTAQTAERAAEAGKGVVQSAGEATAEVAGAVKAGGGEVVRQGRGLWQDVVIPTMNRFAQALPSVVKAVIFLVAFWIVAMLAGAVVSKLLGLTRLDERAARDWGLAGLLEDKEGKSRSLAKLAGGVVKWVILLFGFVAFFNALNLQMVAGPLQNIVDKIVGVIPNLLKAAVILFVYWVVAAVVRMAVTKGLGAAKFDERAGKYFPTREIKGVQVGPSALAGRLLFYVILLFGIPPFLQALGQQSLVAPLQEMLGKTLAFLPNIAAAAIIVFVGAMIATIVREVVANFLAAVGADGGAERLGFGRIFGHKKLSGVAGAIAYFFIIVPIVMAAVDSLQITAISGPVKSTLARILAAVPALLVAAVIVAIGYAVARVVRGLVQSLLSGIGFDALPEKLKLDFLKPREGHASLSAIAGSVVMFVILLLTAQQALDTLGFAQLSALADQVVRYLPSLFMGLLILVATLSLGQVVGSLVSRATQGSSHSRLVSGVARYAILFLGVSMTLDQLGVGTQIVATAVGAVLGGTALALGLAFGLGGKEKAKEVIEKRGEKSSYWMSAREHNQSEESS
jgi:hypothetical protein